MLRRLFKSVAIVILLIGGALFGGHLFVQYYPEYGTHTTDGYVLGDATRSTTLPAVPAIGSDELPDVTHDIPVTFDNATRSDIAHALFATSDGITIADDGAVRCEHDDEVLQYDRGKKRWTCVSPTETVFGLLDKTVTLTNDGTLRCRNDNEQLYWNTAKDKWHCGRVGNGIVVHLTDIDDVAILAPQANDFLVYDGTQWRNTDALTVSSLTSGGATGTAALFVSGNSILGGTLTVGGAATFGDNVTVTGATALSTLTTSGDATFGGNTTTTGTATAAGFTTTGTTATGTLTTSGDATIGGNTAITGTLTLHTLTPLRLVATDTNNNLVSTITEANMESSVSDVTNIFTNNDIIPASNIADNFLRNDADDTTIGTITAAGFTTTGTTATGTLTVSGNATVGGTLGVTGATTIANDLTVDTNTLYVDSASNRVGIGITTPTDKLHVAGDLRLTGAFKDSANTAGTSGQILTSTGSGTAWTSANSLGVDTLYTADGTLTGNRTVTLGTNTLNFAGTGTGDFSVNSNQLFVDTSTGNVGIGTTNPGAKLNVAGDSLFGGTSAGSVGSVEITTGGVSPINNRLTYGTDGTGWKFAIGKNQAGTVTDQFVIQDNGNVGIGTTSPHEKLEVDGTILASAGLGDETWSRGYLSGGNGIPGLPKWTEFSTPNTYNGIYNSAGNLISSTKVWSTNTSEYQMMNVGDYAEFSVPRQNAWDINNGKVLVSIAGHWYPSGTNGSFTAALEFWNSNTSSWVSTGTTITGYGTTMHTVSIPYHNPPYITKARVRILTDGGGSGVRISMVRLFSRSAYGEQIPLVQGGIGYFDNVYTSGNVGIGTTNPGYKLDVFDNSSPAEIHVKGSGNGYTNAGVVLESTNSTNGRGLGIFMYDQPAGFEWYAGTPYGSDDQYQIGRQGSLSNHDYGTAQTSNAFLTVKNTGNVGIGTTSPSSKLEVNGDIEFSGTLKTSSGEVRCPTNQVMVGFNTSGIICEPISNSIYQ